MFLSNLPEGLSSSAGMKRAGRTARYVFSVWAAIALVSGVASLAGFLIFRDVGAELISATMGIAAGAILAMIVDTMAPEAVEHSHELTGILAAAGFQAAFALSRWAE